MEREGSEDKKRKAAGSTLAPRALPPGLNRMPPRALARRLWPAPGFSFKPPLSSARRMSSTYLADVSPPIVSLALSRRRRPLSPRGGEPGLPRALAVSS